MSTKTKSTSAIARLGELPRTVAGRVSSLPRDVAERGREVWLTGLGTIATMEEEGTNAYEYVVRQRDRLVKRGEKLEARGKARLGAVRQDAGELTSDVGSAVVEPVMKTLRRLGIPTRSELGELSAKVDLLTRRVNLLIERLDSSATVTPARPVWTVRAREDGGEVAMEGDDRPVGVHPTKDAAVEQGRELATEQAPSQLVVYKKDGTLQDTFAYDA